MGRNDPYQKTKHHILPVARGGTNFKNIVILNRSTHEAWHTLFANLTNEEALVMISMIMIRSYPGEQINVHDARRAAVNKKLDDFYCLHFTIKLDGLPVYFVEAWKEFFGEKLVTIGDCKEFIEIIMVPGKRFTREGFIAERENAIKAKKRRRERTAA